MGRKDASTGKGTFGGNWMAEKHGIGGLGRRMSCANTGGPILMICTSFDVILCKELPFRVAIIASALKFLMALFVKLRLIP